MLYPELLTCTQICAGLDLDEATWRLPAYRGGRAEVVDEVDSPVGGFQKGGLPQNG